MDIRTVGTDLAKRILSICCFDTKGNVVARADFKFDAFAAYLRTLAAGTVVAMEACSTAHYWGRLCLELGLIPRLMAPEFVIPYRKRKSAKNDRADAEAIGIAAQQPTMRFVTVKTEAQQARLTWHRVREGWKKDRTALICRIRGLLLEFGHPIANGANNFRRDLALSCENSTLPASFREILREAKLDLEQLDLRMARCDLEISRSARTDEDAQRLQVMNGVGAITADAVCATVGDALNFKNGRQFAAWTGLTPKQFSSGGKTKQGKVTCAGDTYLRTMLVQGARSALQRALKRSPEQLTRLERWMVALRHRVGWHKALIAIANKHARQLWAILAKGENYDPEAWRRYGQIQSNAVAAADA